MDVDRLRMTNFRGFVVLTTLGLAACSSRSVTKTTHYAPDPQAGAYASFVAKRTDELLKSGVCKNVPDADKQARLDADRVIGRPGPETTVTTTWGAGAQRELQKAEIESGLDKMKRDSATPKPRQ